MEKGVGEEGSTHTRRGVCVNNCDTKLRGPMDDEQAVEFMD